MWLDWLRQDIAYGLRQLRRSPSFACTAILTLALGIGGLTATFALVDVVLLRSLPVANPQQLYAVGDAQHVGAFTGMAGDWDIFSRDFYEHLRDQTDGFQDLAAFQADPRRVSVRPAGRQIAARSNLAQFVSGNYFSMLGARMMVGRPITATDDRAGAPPVTVLTYREWQSDFGADPSVVGATLQINGLSVVVVGVTPPEFFGEALRGNPPDLWLPLASDPAIDRAALANNPDVHWLYLMGRIQPHVDVRTIEAQMQVSVRRWLADHPTGGPSAAEQLPHQTLHLKPAAGGVSLLRATYASGLELLLAIAAFVLLIVCANVSNLTLVRSLARQRTVAISLAVGASRARVIHQALVQNFLLAIGGCLVGLAIASVGSAALMFSVLGTAASAPLGSGSTVEVLLCAVAAAFVAALLSGIAPAWIMSLAQPLGALNGSRGATERIRTLPQQLLVAIQIALSLTLLVATLLLLESFRQLQHQSLGYTAEGRLVTRIDPSLAGYSPDQLEPLYVRIRDRLGRIPGVIGVSYALSSPMGGGGWSADVEFDGRPPETYDGEHLASWNRVGPDYFETVGTPIVRGRAIVESDTPSASHIAVVNEEFARRFFPHGDALGHFFGVGVKASKSFRIVGIAADAKYRSPAQPAVAMYFLPRAQVTAYQDPGLMSFETRSLFVNDIIVRHAGRAAPLEQSIRETLTSIDPAIPIVRIQSFDEQLGGQLKQEQLIVQLTAIFGGLALLLTLIGVYGVTAFSASQRTRDVAIRIALGAKRFSVFGVVIRECGASVVAGLCIGAAAALGAGLLLRSRLYGVTWYSPVYLGAAIATLALFALMAMLVPAKRATAVDPIEALRLDA